MVRKDEIRLLILYISPQRFGENRNAVFLFCCFCINKHCYFAEVIISTFFEIVYYLITEYKTKSKAVKIMNTKQRVLALKYLRKQEKNPTFANELGIEVKIIQREKKEG